MGKPNWMKFDPDKIALDVDGMSLEQEGAYMRCVRHIWRNGPLPEARLSKVCGNAWEAVKACAVEYDGGLSFAWLEDARSEAHGRSKRASVAGVASFNARSTDVQHKFNGRSTDVLSISKSSSTSNGQEGKENTEKKTPFDAFWTMYAKGSRKLSAQAWDTLSEPDRVACLSATPAYLKSKPDPVYRKDGERYLRHRTWEDPITVAVPQANGKPVPMTRSEALAKLEEYRAANGISPGGVVETHLIPADIYAALK